MKIQSYRNYFKTKRIVNKKKILFTFNTNFGCSIGPLIKQIELESCSRRMKRQTWKGVGV